jgi:hypothetical protein
VRTTAHPLDERRPLARTVIFVALAALRCLVFAAPAKENWTYSYLSIESGSKALGGPYTATFDSAYTVAKSSGRWLVDSVQSTAQDTVK